MSEHFISLHKDRALTETGREQEFFCELFHINHKALSLHFVLISPVIVVKFF